MKCLAIHPQVDLVNVPLFADLDERFEFSEPILLYHEIEMPLVEVLAEIKVTFSDRTSRTNTLVALSVPLLVTLMV